MLIVNKSHYLQEEHLAEPTDCWSNDECTFKNYIFKNVFMIHSTHIVSITDRGSSLKKATLLGMLLT